QSSRRELTGKTESRVLTMAKRESEMRRAPETDETVNVAYKAGTPLQAGKISETDQIHLFNDINIQETQQGGFLDSDEHNAPKVFREEEDPDVRESIEQIGGGPGEARDIAGKPITPEDARIIQSTEIECGFPTGKGSLSARAQSAAAANVKEGTVDQDGGRSATLY
ncbi:hypothetical protein KI387_018070, partial [Taxus chinensis]